MTGAQIEAVLNKLSKPDLHCVKSVQIRIRKNSVFGHFSCSACTAYFKYWS